MAEKEWEKIKGSINLFPGEKSAYIWWGVAYFEPQRQLKGDFQLVTLGGHRGRKYREGSGSVVRTGDLVLTNRRLILLEKKGMITKDFHVAFDIPLESISGVSSQGLVPKLTITDTKGRHEFRLKDVGKAIEVINNKIKEQKEKPTETVAPSQQTTVVAICPECKNRIPAESKFCPECGANLQPR